MRTRWLVCSYTYTRLSRSRWFGTLYNCSLWLSWSWLIRHYYPNAEERFPALKEPPNDPWRALLYSSIICEYGSAANSWLFLTFHSRPCMANSILEGSILNFLLTTGTHYRYSSCMSIAAKKWSLGNAPRHCTTWSTSLAWSDVFSTRLSRKAGRYTLCWDSLVSIITTQLRHLGSPYSSLLCSHRCSSCLYSL